MIINKKTVDLSKLHGDVNYIAIIGDNRFIVGSEKGHVHLFSLDSDNLSIIFHTDNLSMTCHAVNLTTQRLALGLEKGNVMIYDLKTYERKGTIKA